MHPSQNRNPSFLYSPMPSRTMLSINSFCVSKCSCVRKEYANRRFPMFRRLSVLLLRVRLKRGNLSERGLCRPLKPGKYKKRHRDWMNHHHRIRICVGWSGISRSSILRTQCRSDRHYFHPITVHVPPLTCRYRIIRKQSRPTLSSASHSDPPQ